MKYKESFMTSYTVHCWLASYIIEFMIACRILSLLFISSVDYGSICTMNEHEDEC